MGAARRRRRKGKEKGRKGEEKGRKGKEKWRKRKERKKEKEERERKEEKEGVSRSEQTRKAKNPKLRYKRLVSSYFGYFTLRGRVIAYEVSFGFPGEFVCCVVCL